MNVAWSHNKFLLFSMLLQKMMKAMSMKKSMKKKVFKMQKLAVWKVRGAA